MKYLILLVLFISTFLHAGGPYEGFNPTYPSPPGTEGSVITGSIANSVVFTNGSKALTTDADLNWDGSTNRLGIGITADAALDVQGAAEFNNDNGSTALSIKGSGSLKGVFTPQAGGLTLESAGGYLELNGDDNDSNTLYIEEGGDVGIGIAPSERLHVTGTGDTYSLAVSTSSSGTPVALGVENDGDVVIGTNRALTINANSSLTTSSQISMSNTKDWAIVNSTAGTGSNAIYIAELGDYQWGAHIHSESTSIGSIGLAVGAHGLDNRGIIFDTAGSTASIGIMGFQSASSQTGDMITLRAETVWQDALYPSLTPTYSGTFSGNFISFYDRSINVFRVNSSGNPVACDSLGTSCLTMGFTGATPTISSNNSKSLLLQSASNSTFMYNAAGDGNVAFAPGTTGTTVTPSAGPLVVVPQAGAASGFQLLAVATQTIADTNTIAADSCGGVKRVTSAGSVTTNTTNTFTALSALVQCEMKVCNIGAQNIILDQQTAFKTTGGANLTLGANTCVGVAWDGAFWRQTAAALTAT